MPTAWAEFRTMINPLVTDLAADGVPLAVTCRVLGFSLGQEVIRLRNVVEFRFNV